MKPFQRLRAAFLGAALVLSSAFTAAVAADPVNVRFILDWKAQGPHSWFYYARDAGYFKEEGLNVVIDQGDGSAAAVTRIMTGTYDAGFGDINASIQMAAQQPGKAPVMVSLLYNRAPFAIIARRDTGITTLKALEGRTILTPAGSATFKLFPALAQKNGVDAAKVKVNNAAPNLIEQLLVRKESDAVAQFGATSYMNFIAMGLDPEKDFNWFFYSDHGLDVYSNGILVSPQLMREKPEAVRGLLRAIHRAIRDIAVAPDKGIASLKTVEPLTDAKLERQRMLYMLKHQMYTPETAELGLGDLKDSRLAASIDTIAAAYELKQKPAVGEIFNRSFLPPKAERVLPPLAN